MGIGFRDTIWNRVRVRVRVRDMIRVSVRDRIMVRVRIRVMVRGTHFYKPTHSASTQNPLRLLRRSIPR